VIKHLLRESYNEIYNQLYNLTSGKIIIGGSVSLRLQSIIDRNLNDLDVNILYDDWIVYKSSLETKFKMYPSIQIKYKELKYDVYNCFDKVTKLNEFHLFVNYGCNIYNVLNLNKNNVRVIKPEYHLMDKKMIFESGQDINKHLNDINSIQKYLNEK
jgi:hypothetical protein